MLPLQFPVQVDLKQQTAIYRSEVAPPTHVPDHFEPQVMNDIDVQQRLPATNREDLRATLTRLKGSDSTTSLMSHKINYRLLCSIETDPDFLPQFRTALDVHFFLSHQNACKSSSYDDDDPFLIARIFWGTMGAKLPESTLDQPHQARSSCVILRGKHHNTANFIKRISFTPATCHVHSLRVHSESQSSHVFPLYDEEEVPVGSDSQRGQRRDAVLQLPISLVADRVGKCQPKPFNLFHTPTTKTRILR